MKDRPYINKSIDETRVASKTPIQIELWSFDKKKDMQLIYRNYE